MKIENCIVTGLETAARIAWNCYPQGNDSAYNTDIVWNKENQNKYNYKKNSLIDYCLGPETIDVMQVCSEDDNFLEFINVQADITIPCYLLTELLLLDRESKYNALYIDEYYNTNNDSHDYGFDTPSEIWDLPVMEANDVRWIQLDIKSYCNMLINKYVETEDYRYWKALLEITPLSKLVKVTISTNYSILRKLFFKLPHISRWDCFFDGIKKLPYGEELICYQGEEG